MDVLNKGGCVYYTDTDSIVTDVPLDKNFIGKEIGKFKLEYDINEAFFINTKTYCLVTNKGMLLLKCWRCR